MPKILIAAAILFALFLICTTMLGNKKNGKNKTVDLSSITRRAPLTDHEKKMFQLLKIALPNNAVLAQVAFSSLVTTKIRSTRNRFDRKVADFVICDKALNVVAIIELDDSSHQGREKQDKDRDALLSAANYQTIRYNKIPTIDTIRQDIARMTEPPTTTTTTTSKVVI